jgi:subtilisin family serine protease
VSDAQFRYSFGANKPSPSYGDVAGTEYRFAQLNVGTPIEDTLYNSSGDRIATVEVYSEYMGNNFHLQALFKVDSTDYLMRFNTTGDGKYDLWSGKWINLNKIVTDIPIPADYPPIVNYVQPDTLQSLVSSWNCSPHVISVANIRCRAGHVDLNGNYYTPGDGTLPGEIAPTSSIGPTRDGVLKPDISATGDVTLGSAPLFMVGNSTYNSQLGEGGYHLRNGGTSMASPVVAGIAALYLERCGESSVQDFKNDLFATAMTDSYTGTSPNVQYGNGKIDAFELLKNKNGNLTILGDTLICQKPIELTTNINLQNYEWSTGSFAPQIVIPQPDTVYLSGIDNQGCKMYSDTLVVEQGSPLPNPNVTVQGDSLMASSAPNYQWYLNDQPISGATSQYYTPTTPGYYSVAVQGDDNCKSFSNAIDWLLSLNQEELADFIIYPNPAREQINITSSGQKMKQVVLVSTQGKIISTTQSNSSEVTISINQLAKGMYTLRIKTKGEIEEIPFLKY